MGFFSQLRAKRIDDLGFGTFRVLVGNENGSYQHPVQMQKKSMPAKLRGLGYNRAADEFESYIEKERQ